MCAITHLYVCLDLFKCVPWLIQMCVMTHSHMCDNSFRCVPWLLQMCAMTHFHGYVQGFGRIVANKAGVAICLDLFSTSFLFVTAHFAAGFLIFLHTELYICTHIKEDIHIQFLHTYLYTYTHITYMHAYLLWLDEIWSLDYDVI